MNRVFQAARRFLWLSLAMMLVAVASPAMAKQHAQKADQGDDAPAASISGTTVNELHKLMAAKALTELRTTYNGTYGASLLFYADKMTYYVVLFHNKDFWRVIKTDQVKKAESVYDTFVDQSRKLAQVDIDTIRLEAGRKYSQHLLSVNNQRLQTLREDLQRQHQQAKQIAQDQQQARHEAIQLTQSLQSSSSQLESLRQRIQALKKRQADLRMELPQPQQAPAPAASGSAMAPASTAPVAASPAQDGGKQPGQ